MTKKEYAELLKEIHEADEMWDKANQKLCIRLLVFGVLLVLSIIFIF